MILYVADCFAGNKYIGENGILSIFRVLLQMADEMTD